MDYQTIQSLVQDTVDDNSAITLLVLKKYINDSYREINRRFDWPYLETVGYRDLTDGTRTIDLSTLSPEIQRIRSIAIKASTGANEQYSLLEPLSRPRYEQYEDQITEGVPMGWAFEGGQNTIALLPIPNYTLASGMRVTYTKRVADMSGNTDEPVFPDEWHQVLVDGASWKWYQREDDIRADIYRNYFEQAIRRMYTELITRHSQGVPRIQFMEG